MMYGGWYGVAMRFDRIASLIVGPYAKRFDVPPPARLESMWRQSYGDANDVPPGVTWGYAFLAFPALHKGNCNDMVWTVIQSEPVTLWGE